MVWSTFLTVNSNPFDAVGVVIVISDVDVVTSNKYPLCVVPTVKLDDIVTVSRYGTLKTPADQVSPVPAIVGLTDNPLELTVNPEFDCNNTENVFPLFVNPLPDLVKSNDCNDPPLNVNPVPILRETWLELNVKPFEFILTENVFPLFVNPLPLKTFVPCEIE